jgi:hypothetical protein
LFELLGRFEDPTQRKIENLHSLLPGSAFFTDSMTNTPRNEWLRNALESTGRSELVFLDPDNGIGPRSSQKHISCDELKSFWDRKQSLLIYHHLSRRKGGHVEEATEMKIALEKLMNTSSVLCFHFRRGNSRVYFLAMQPAHEVRLRGAINEDRLKALKCTKREWAAYPSPSL